MQCCCFYFWTPRRLTFRIVRHLGAELSQKLSAVEYQQQSRGKYHHPAQTKTVNYTHRLQQQSSHSASWQQLLSNYLFQKSNHDFKAALNDNLADKWRKEEELGCHWNERKRCNYELGSGSLLRTGITANGRKMTGKWQENETQWQAEVGDSVTGCCSRSLLSAAFKQRETLRDSECKILPVTNPVPLTPLRIWVSLSSGSAEHPHLSVSILWGGRPDRAAPSSSHFSLCGCERPSLETTPGSGENSHPGCQLAFL